MSSGPWKKLKGLSHEMRFVSLCGPPDERGCIPWLGPTTRHGYGVYRKPGERRLLKAHRVSYEDSNGLIPDGQVVMHECDNRVCVAAAHLLVGTLLDNNRDRDAKQRQAHNRGERGGGAKLSNVMADEVRVHLARGVSQQILAKTFGVSQAAISRIKRNKSYQLSTERAEQ